jgi:hypothetical protein
MPTSLTVEILRREAVAFAKAEFGDFQTPLALAREISFLDELKLFLDRNRVEYDPQYLL